MKTPVLNSFTPSGQVVLVSMDGFRHDYLTKTNNTPHFDAFKVCWNYVQRIKNHLVSQAHTNGFTVRIICFSKKKICELSILCSPIATR